MCLFHLGAKKNAAESFLFCLCKDNIKKSWYQKQDGLVPAFWLSFFLFLNHTKQKLFWRKTAVLGLEPLPTPVLLIIKWRFPLKPTSISLLTVWTKSVSKLLFCTVHERVRMERGVDQLLSGQQWLQARTNDLHLVKWHVNSRFTWRIASNQTGDTSTGGGLKIQTLHFTSSEKCKYSKQTFNKSGFSEN